MHKITACQLFLTIVLSIGWANDQTLKLLLVLISSYRNNQNTIQKMPKQPYTFIQKDKKNREKPNNKGFSVLVISI